MLERYSHIRIAAKRDAMAGLRIRADASKAENSQVVPVVEQTVTIQ